MLVCSEDSTHPTANKAMALDVGRALLPVLQNYCSPVAPPTGRVLSERFPNQSRTVQHVLPAERQDYGSFVGRVTLARPLLVAKAGRARVPILQAEISCRSPYSPHNRAASAGQRA